MNFGLKILFAATILVAISACGKKGDIKPPSSSGVSAVSFSFSLV